ncbi:MAG: sulfite oxidase [Alphaproteobacteria bacterium]|nr:sulfite oxidase [Alphaproteobacteria bacterium]
MAGKRERSLNELYLDDPERADAVVFGRRAAPGRRGFLKGAGLAALSAAVGGPIAFADRLPSGLLPVALAQGTPPGGPKILSFEGKEGVLVSLGDRPLVAETPEHQLDDDTTPNAKFFIRNNGIQPQVPADPEGWTLTVDGEVNTPLGLSLGDIKKRFPTVDLTMVLECGGNGRSQFNPPARGNQWTNGGTGCARWTGVRLRDLLQAAGVKPSASHTGHYGADQHLSGEAGKVVLSRGMPLAKAMEEHSLVAWAMNGVPLPAVHGFPVRLVVPGWPGSLSNKWLTRIWVRDKPHDGPGMGGTSYSVPIKPMVPGGKVDEKNSRDLQSMPVRAIITSPANGTELGAGARTLALRGKAWAGDFTVARVDVSIDYGATWLPSTLGQPRNRYDWQKWQANVTLPSEGYYEVWARATDGQGRMQPHVAGNWNPQGYGANAMHRVAVLVSA